MVTPYNSETPSPCASYDVSAPSLEIFKLGRRASESDAASPGGLPLDWAARHSVACRISRPPVTVTGTGTCVERHGA